MFLLVCISNIILVTIFNIRVMLHLKESYVTLKTLHSLQYRSRTYQRKKNRFFSNASFKQQFRTLSCVVIVYSTRFFQYKVRFIHAKAVARSHSRSGKKYAYCSRGYCLSTSYLVLCQETISC